MVSSTVVRSPRRPGRSSQDAPGPTGRSAPALTGSQGRQRRWSLALIAALVTLGSALAFAVLWMNAGDRKPVLVVARDVVGGQVITDDDLSVVRVAADPGVDPIPSSQRGEVVGREAATDLVAGTVLVAGHLGDDEGLEPGTAVIAVPVPTVELPSPDLRPGDRVLLIVTPPAGAPGTDAVAERIGEARVFAVESPSDFDTTVRVSLTVDDDLVPAIAAAIRDDVIYLALSAGA